MGERRCGVTAVDRTRVWSSLAALAAVFALAAVLAYVSMTVNRPPVILVWEARPARLGRDARAILRVQATDPDGGPLRYEYKADRGRITVDAAQPAEAGYLPPVGRVSFDSVTVTVTDDRGLSATATTSVTIDVPVPATTPMPPPTDALPLAALMPFSRTPTPAPPATNPASPVPPSPTPRPTPIPDPLAPPSPNHAPVLDKGSTIEGLGVKSIVLVANGYEPDGDPIEYEWDTKGCFDVIHQSESSIEVKFGYCTRGAITLTWRDPHGLTASAEWTLSK